MIFSRQKRMDKLLSAALILLAGGAIAAGWMAFKPLRRQMTPLAATASPVAVAAAAPKKAPEAVPPSAPAKAAETAPVAAEVPFTLPGIFFSEAGNSFIFLEVGKETRICRAGDVIEGWKLTKIERGSVQFEHNGSEASLALAGIRYESGPSFASAATDPAVSPMAQAASAGPRDVGGKRGGRTERPLGVARSTTTASAPTLISKSLRESVDATVAVARDDAVRGKEAFEKAWQENPASVMQGAIDGVKIQPLIADGQMQGFVLGSVPVASLAARYSLAPGDRILAVNDRPLNSLENAMQVYRNLGVTDSVTITLERAGVRKKVLYYLN